MSAGITYNRHNYPCHICFSEGKNMKNHAGERPNPQGPADQHETGKRPYEPPKVSELFPFKGTHGGVTYEREAAGRGSPSG